MTKLSNNTLIKLIGNITEKFITNETLIEEFSGLLENDNNSIFLNNIIEIISLNSQNKTIDANYTYEFLYRIFFLFFRIYIASQKMISLTSQKKLFQKTKILGVFSNFFGKK